MEILSAKYDQYDGQTNSSITARCAGNIVMHIPIDTDNADYNAIMARHNDANDSLTIEEAD